MKCSKCQAEWMPGNIKSQLLTCPFCGAPLGSATAVDDNQTMQSVMVRIVEQFGEEILSQERKCLAAFKDFAPKLEKEQKILKFAFDEGVHNFFLGCPVAERESHMLKARQAMNALLSDEASLIVVKSFAVALGWNSDGVEQEDVSSKETNNGNNESNKIIKVSEDKSGAVKNQKDDEDYLSPYDDSSCATAIVSPHITQSDKLLQKGNESYEARDSSPILLWYHRAADAGNAKAMEKLGDMYCSGMHFVGTTQIEKNYDEALKWYRKAADAGSNVQDKIEHIQKHLRRHKEEDLVSKARAYLEKDSYEKAFQLLQEAADAGDGEAMFWIGWMYKEGKGVRRDSDEMLKWYQKAANAGYSGAEPVVNRILEEKKNSLCYITTAVCTNLNKPDDCYELTMFRKFRDNWLMMQPDGEALIREYYAVAPTIVQRIDSLPNAHEIYQDIMTKYLKPCLHMIEQKDMEGCKKMYMKMVFEVGNTTSGSSIEKSY